MVVVVIMILVTGDTEGIVDAICVVDISIVGMLVFKLDGAGINPG